ncbi:MAG: NAD(+) synthase [Ruminococcaceae bacterium]|nr:NAD(+) synthase [Oscillospiraceae bacterium]
MKDGFIKVCCATPDIRVADCDFNTQQILACIRKAEGSKVIVFPELCVTGYTCGDLFLQSTLLEGARQAIFKISKETADLDAVIFVGAPVAVHQTIYNCAVILHRGEVIGIVPKKHLPNYKEFSEKRYFSEGKPEVSWIRFGETEVPFGMNLLIYDEQMESFLLSAEICEDLWAANPPSAAHAQAGATVIVNLSASNELVAKRDYRKQLVTGQSARLYAAYLFASAGEGESTTDLVFAGDNMIAENGTLLLRSTPFSNQTIVTEIDLDKLTEERRRNPDFASGQAEHYVRIPVCLDWTQTPLTRPVSRLPFVPTENQAEQAEEILMLQTMGLKKRLVHTNTKNVVIGVSGGLDSTLALLVAVRAFDSAGLDRKGITAITMPCFGTTDRTYHNAIDFANALGVTLREIPVADAVLKHFSDIGHDASLLDVTYENAQARERTQVLMDVANQQNGLVIGTGDLSELALGWATYNGDHMSMYGVNAGVPKTLIRHLVAYEAERTGSDALKRVLEDILDTPVSPELLPPSDGEISQKTEHIVGPYELHDFFLYYTVRYGFAPKKLLRLATHAFSGTYEEDFILQWLKVFLRRFFSQQFKRSCLPDGPKVGSVGLSPRGDWQMPSDAVSALWLTALE